MPTPWLAHGPVEWQTVRREGTVIEFVFATASITRRAPSAADLNMSSHATAVVPGTPPYFSTLDMRAIDTLRIAFHRGPLDVQARTTALYGGGHVAWRLMADSAALAERA